MDSIAEFKPRPYSVRKETACAVALFTSCFHYIAFLSTDWAHPYHRDVYKNFEGLGLWRYCVLHSDGKYTCYKTTELDMPGWFTATQVIYTISFTSIVIDLFLIYFTTCSKRGRASRALLLVFICAAVFTCVSSFVSLTIFGVFIETSGLTLPEEPPEMLLRVGWAYLFACVGTAFHLICPFLGLTEYVKHNRHAHAPADIPLQVRRFAAGKTNYGSTSSIA